MCIRDRYIGSLSGCSSHLDTLYIEFPTSLFTLLITCGCKDVTAVDTVTKAAGVGTPTAAVAVPAVVIALIVIALIVITLIVIVIILGIIWFCLYRRRKR